jgi:hypothetical protein
MGFGIDIFEGDALEFSADVLMVKDWRHATGLDKTVFSQLLRQGTRVPPLGEGEYFFGDISGFAQTSYVLMVGPTMRQMRSYADIRSLAFDMLKHLKTAHPEAAHVSTNIQGSNRGFDEREALRAMLLGFNDAFEQGEYPPSLTHITIAELFPHRAALLRVALQEILPPTTLLQKLDTARSDVANILSGMESFAPEEQRPIADETTPHIFVAMPFAEAYDDQYYLAIYPAVQELGYLCVRLDQVESAFTGNIIEEIKEKIRTASLVIGLLDSSNPNVYLEVGYAWGREIPTLLLLHESQTNEVPFDVRGERLIHYKQIYKLRDELTKNLKVLLKKN